MSQDHEHLARAVELAGGQTELARKLRSLTGRPYKQAHVWNWLNRGDKLPPEIVIPIETIIGGAVNRSQLRPDLYPPDDQVVTAKKAPTEPGGADRAAGGSLASAAKGAA